MNKKRNKESGMVIVEATIVFPVMFLVIFLMIFAGNAYLQKCRVEAIINEMTIDGAAYCADPMLDEIEGGSIPSLNDIDVRPYRYLFGGMSDIESEIESKVNSKISNMSTGLFSNMKPSSAIVAVDYNNGFIYSTFLVEIEYKIRMPVRLLGASDNISLNISTCADMPVSDSSEFLRNIDMVEDYIEKYFGQSPEDKIDEMIQKAKEWFK